MPAEEIPSPQPNQSDPIKRFRQKYAEALGDAHDAARLTDEATWQRMYHERRDRVQKERDDAAKSLRVLADALQSGAMFEDEAKAIKDIVKAEEARQTAMVFFERDVIERVTAPVETCRRLIEEANENARREEQGAPLHNVGLYELMKAETAAAMPVRWNAETGRVTVG